MRFILLSVIIYDAMNVNIISCLLYEMARTSFHHDLSWIEGLVILTYRNHVGKCAQKIITDYYYYCKHFRKSTSASVAIP